MKIVIGITIIFVMLSVFSWLGIAFYANNYSMSTWNQDMRATFIICEVCIIILSPMLGGLINAISKGIEI